MTTDTDFKLPSWHAEMLAVNAARESRRKLAEAEEALDQAKALVVKREDEVQTRVDEYLAAKLLYELAHARINVDYPDVYPAWIGEPWPDTES